MRSRAIAIFEMTDENGAEAKVIGVPSTDPRYEHLQDLGDLPKFRVEAIHHLFQECKVLESEKSVWGFAWSDRAAADAEVERALERGEAHHAG